tara:strand:+ start:1537 stop:1746 length:210 start_codon:yes stop_codon:yes gene_type:complete
MGINVGRARGITKLKNRKANNQGAGNVVSKAAFMGKGIVLRKQLTQRAVCISNNCYDSKQMKPANQTGN